MPQRHPHWFNPGGITISQRQIQIGQSDCVTGWIVQQICLFKCKLSLKGNIHSAKKSSHVNTVNTDILKHDSRILLIYRYLTRKVNLSKVSDLGDLGGRIGSARRNSTAERVSKRTTNAKECMHSPKDLVSMKITPKKGSLISILCVGNERRFSTNGKRKCSWLYLCYRRGPCLHLSFIGMCSLGEEATFSHRLSN